MRILVTGASGFVGRALVPVLAAAGHEVRVAARQAPAPSFGLGVEVMRHCDLAAGVDWAPLVDGMEGVVHLAGIAHTRPGDVMQRTAAKPGEPAPRDRAADIEARYDRVNHLATADLAHATKDIRRFVFLSSIRAQSGPACDRVLTEADPPRPTDPYGRSKRAAEIAVARSGVPFTILRPVLIYGPGVKGNLAALKRLAALPVPLPFGAFQNRRSLLGIRNLVAAVLHVLGDERCAGRTFCVADPSAVTLAEIVTALRRGRGKPARLVAFPPGMIRLGLAAFGAGSSWNQLGGQLIADSAALVATGWRPDPDTLAALAAMARDG